MGNRAVITTPERKIGLYLHWNGGRDTVEPLLRYCELKGYRAPSSDSYGWARFCQVVGNFFGGTLSVGIAPYSDDRRMNPGDNGIYVVDGWKIVDRILPYKGFVEKTNTISTGCSARSMSPCPKTRDSARCWTPQRWRLRNLSSATRCGLEGSTASTPPTRWSPSMMTGRRSWRATTTTATGHGTPTTASRRNPS